MSVAMFAYGSIGEAFTFEAGSEYLQPVELHGDDAGAAEDDAEVAGLPVQEVGDDLHAGFRSSVRLYW